MTDNLTMPESITKCSDKRAREIFDQEAAYGKSFNECLGMIYLVGMRAGIEAIAAMGT